MNENKEKYTKSIIEILVSNLQFCFNQYLLIANSNANH